MKETFDFRYGDTEIHIPEPVAGTTFCLSPGTPRSAIDEQDLTSRGVRIEERMTLAPVCGNDCGGDDDVEELFPQVVLSFPPFKA